MMDSPYEGGYSVIVQKDDSVKELDSREIEVFFPPTGKVYQRHPRWKEYEELVSYPIFSRSEIEEEQYWDRNAFLDAYGFDYKEKRNQEIRSQRNDPDYVDYELEDFRVQMWEFRINGMWFMNNGTPTYLTGKYWFYLVSWKLDVGYPKFRIPDWEWFCFWQYCTDDKRCLGDVEATRRRQGKTMRSGCILYEDASANREHHSAIQSKTGSDAQKNVYSKGVLSKLKHLWDFFIPKYDREKGKLPKSGLYFTETNVRGAVSLEDTLDELDELNSMITWKTADHVAYDGEKIHVYVGDEVGKTVKPINVYTRHMVIKYCLLDDNYQVIGKAHYTTTVEEMVAGGQIFKLLWDSSNQSRRDDNGQTASGLYRYFMPAHRTLFIDKYGYADEVRAMKKIMNARKALKDAGNYIALASDIRKTPITVQEMFYVDPENCLFDAIKINDRLDHLTWKSMRELYHIGNLHWTEGRGTDVKFREASNGRWWISKRFDVYDPNLWNQTIKEGSQYKPNSDNAGGIDPFSHNKTKDNKNSNGACYVGTKPSSEPSKSMVPILEYIHRPPTAPLFYEDMLMTMHFTGAIMAVEDNKIGLINYAEEHGYKYFVKEFDGKRGITATTGTHGHIVTELEDFVSGLDEDIKKCDFVRLLNDLFDFDINDTEKNDESMAFAYYRICCYSYKYRKKESKNVSLSNELIPVENLFPKS
jgi:hypothetical protein